MNRCNLNTARIEGGMQSYNKFSGLARETKNGEKDYI